MISFYHRLIWSIQKYRRHRVFMRDPIYRAAHLAQQKATRRHRKSETYQQAKQNRLHEMLRGAG